MNILVCSRNNEFLSNLAHRLKNENHEIYLLTGEHVVKDRRIPKVFQKYDFTYSDENVVKVMNNISIDLLVIAGYMDFDFTEESSQKKSIEYITGMTNLILSAKSANVKRVIYCSSLRIFEDNVEEYISKDTRPVTNSFESGALSQIDAFITSCREEGEFDVVNIRFPEIYGNFSYDQFTDDFCTNMILNRVDNKTVKYNPNAKHMVLGVQDAVHALINAISSEEKNELYHIEGEVCREVDIANIVVKQGKGKNNVPEEVVGRTPDKLFPLSVLEADNKKLHLKSKYTLAEEVPQIYKKISKYRENLTEKKEQSSLKKVIRTILETSVFFLLVVFLEYLVYSLALEIDINFYLLFVIIVAVIYGVSYAMFATVLSVLGNIFFVVSDLVITSSNVGYDLFIQVLQLVLCGVIVGLMRDNYKRKNLNLEEINQYNVEQLADVTRINESNVYVKNIYEKRISAYSNNLARMYHIISQLSFLDARKVIFQTAKVVSEFIETEHVAIYVSSKNSNMYRLAAHTSSKGVEMGKSLRVDDSSFFFDAMNNHEVYMNRHFDVEYPSYVSAIYGEGEKVDAIIMIWAMRLDQISLYQSTIISILSRLVEKTMISAVQYENLYFDNSYIKNTRIMNIDAFKEKIEVYQNGYEMGLISYTIIKPYPPKGKKVEDIFEQAQKLVRDTDYLGSDMENLYIILSNSDLNDTKFVTDRFNSNDIFVEIIEKDVLVGEKIE